MMYSNVIFIAPNVLVFILLVISFTPILLVNGSHSNKISEDPTYCERHELLKAGDKIGTTYINENGQETTIWKDRICPTFHSNNLKFFLSLFLMIAWGGVVRTFLRVTKLNIPYTVILMMTGLIIGLGTRIQGVIPLFKEKDGITPLTFCSFWSTYTKIARIHPKLILYIFLPILIFESAFNMKVHVFMKSAWQILLVALPGMLITTFITAGVCQLFMFSYHWSFAQACLFGSIISATDPVAVVAILRELGISDKLSTMIEGESLFNDGIAIVLYEVFEDIVQVQSGGNIKIGVIFKKFLSISIGGPVLGVVMAKIAVTCLSLIFNDATVEITITLVAAYSTYYFGEALGFSGVVAVVVLGIRMSADSTCISPNAEALVHHFWEMLGYLANTVLFVLVGVVISETAISHISMLDLLYLLLLYVFLNAIRLIMLTILMPFLCRIGYGLKWSEMIVMMWGGLRGAVGLCLALEVYRNKELCEIENDKIGPKILFHTAGIVMLTLLVNGTSTRLLLNILKLNQVSEGKIDQLKNAMKHVIGAQIRALAVQKQVRFLADSNWDLVDKFTRIYNPFQNKRVKSTPHITKIITTKLEHEYKFMKKDDLHGAIIYQAKEVEYMEEARLRLLKALKIFFWKQYGQGVLTESATQILVKVTECIEDEENRMIHWEDFSNHWRVQGLFHWFQKHMMMRFWISDLSISLQKPNSRFRQIFWRLTTRPLFNRAIHCLVLINLIPVIIELIIQIKNLINGQYPKRQLTFFIINILFTLMYMFEFLIKIISFGWINYWIDKRNYIDIALIISNVVDIGMTITFEQSQLGIILMIELILRLGFRTLEIIRPWLPQIYKFIDSRTKQSLFLGYDIGTGFVLAVDDILKFLPQIALHPNIFNQFKSSLEHERRETLRAMGILQKDNPEVAIGVKTRHASRTVLNQMNETLHELKEDGLLGDKENIILKNILEERMKLVLRSPSSISPPAAETILENVIWILGNSKLTKFIFSHAVLRRFNFSDKICTAGEPSDGIYVIISGMIKMHYTPSAEIIAAKTIGGQIPNKDFFINLSFEVEEIDLFSTGTVIGELGVLTEQKIAATIICETKVTAYHISNEDMKDALAIFNDRIDSLESRIWRSCGLRIAAALLPSLSAFQAWTGNKIRMHLERSSVPISLLNERLNIPDFISTVILLHGQIMDFQTKDIFIAPCVLPHTCIKLSQCEDSVVEGRIMLIAHEEIDYYEHDPQMPCSRQHSAISKKRIDTPVHSEMKLDTRKRRLSMVLNPNQLIKYQ